MNDVVSTLNPLIILALAVATGGLLGAVITSIIFGRRLNQHASQHQAAMNDQLAQAQVLKEEIHRLEKQIASDQAAIAQFAELRQKLEESQRDVHQLGRDNATLKTQLEVEQRHFGEQMSLLKNAKEQLTKEFENLANSIFEKKQSQFTQSSQTTLQNTLNPLKEQIKDFKRQVEDAYHKENAERNKLIGQITELQKQTQKIGEDAVNLATALKGNNKAQGNWGEVILERLLEESGLQKGREYETQVSLKDEDGKRRNPDVIIRLPENKDIVIDAKVSLLSYETYINSENDEERAAALKGHVSSLKAHIDGLSKKNYESLDNIRTLDFVFIFIPIEAAFMVALEQEPGIFQYAYDKQIVLVSPTTLLATLRTVENIWRYEKQNRNAEKIANMAGGLHDQFSLVVDSLEELGQSIGKTQEAYDKTQKRLQSGRGNLYKRIQDLEKLGAKTKRQLKHIDPADGHLVEFHEEESASEIDPDEAKTTEAQEE
ncbi:DNA recombination protein RmuC [Aurantivibrio plasticivorans]